MKTTLDLPDDLMRTIKIRAAQHDRTLTDLIAELLRRGLAGDGGGSGAVRRRVDLPLVHCARPAREDEEMTPDRVAQILIDDDAAAAART